MQVGSFVRGVGAARTGGPEADSVGMAFVLVVGGVGGGWVGSRVRFRRSVEESYWAKMQWTRERSRRSCRVGGRACSTEIEAGVTSAIWECIGGGRGRWSFAGTGDVGGYVVGKFWNGAENNFWMGTRVNGRVVWPRRISFSWLLLLLHAGQIGSFRAVPGQCFGSQGRVVGLGVDDGDLASCSEAGRASVY